MGYRDDEGRNGKLAATWLSTNNSWDRYKVIQNNQWYFAHVVVRPDKTYTSVISLYDYHDRGGSVVYTQNHLVNDDWWPGLVDGNIVLHLGDSYTVNGPNITVSKVYYKLLK